MKKKENTYQQIKSSEELEEFIHSFWMHKNTQDKPELMTISPDSFFKIIFLIKEDKVINYFMTGLWNEQKEFVIPPKTTTYGCRLKALAPEFLINQEVSSILNSLKQLNLSYLNLANFDFSNFEKIVEQWEVELKKIKLDKTIEANKLRLSQLLYQKKGSISVLEVSQQIYWTNRQINRYLNKYLGVSLKKYLNVQKCYEAYIQIREGIFFPKKGYFDQAHFIREVKKHTGETPKSLYLKQNDRFIQLKNIQPK